MKLKQGGVELVPCAYRTSIDEHVRIEEVRDRDGAPRWAVRLFGACLNRDGDWEDEPLPSNRSDAFKQRCRFATAQEAAEVLATSQQPQAGEESGTGAGDVSSGPAVSPKHAGTA
jgi:hypothetical protein